LQTVGFQLQNRVIILLKLLQDGFKELNITVSDKSLALFEQYYHFYEDYNQKINLSTIKTPSDFAVKHILDCAAGISFFPDHSLLSDLGTGGGFPGVVLKILNPTLQVSLIDVVAKKVTYLKELVRHLQLDIPVFNASAQKVTPKMEIITCRAFAELPKIIREAKKYLRPKPNLILAYKATKEKINEELAGTKNMNPQIFPLVVPFLEAERNMVLIKNI
jgi:16S rRNA (guanine527-N7)-methyltransferase